MSLRIKLLTWVPLVLAGIPLAGCANQSCCTRSCCTSTRCCEPVYQTACAPRCCDDCVSGYVSGPVSSAPFEYEPVSSESRTPTPAEPTPAVPAQADEAPPWVPEAPQPDEPRQLPRNHIPGN